MPPLDSCSVLGSLALVLPLLAVPAPFAGNPQPTTVVTAVRAELTVGRSRERVIWQAPESFAVRTRTGEPSLASELALERNGLRLLSAPPYSRRSDVDLLERRLFAARPDGYSLVENLVQGQSEFVLEQARAGKLRLRPSRVAGRPALRAKVRLYPNTCAALAGGSAEVWVDRATLLPLRLEERRGSVRYRSRVVRLEVDPRLSAAAFAPPPATRRRHTLDYGFVRTSPRSAARRLSYRPLLPRLLPSGFRLAVSGWARRSGVTGPEGSNPRYPQLFGAVYRRGFERIDLTQRLAAGRGWLSDPFGAECQFQLEERVVVHGVPARFATGPETVPHLYWRRGRLLLTVSGPFPKRDLVAIAESLAPQRP